MDEIQQRADLFRGATKKLSVGGEAQNVARVGSWSADGRHFDAFQFKGNYRLAGQSMLPELA
jgi:hypothetical protein